MSSSAPHPPKNRKKRHFDMVSDDPTDLLQDGPPVRLRPRHKGDIIGDALFFGDSLTWGMAHNYIGRYPTPWPRLLEKRLRNVGMRVVEAALCSRTTCWDDPGNEELIPGAEPHHFNGLQHFTTVFSCHSPKWLILLLGTNDLKVKIRSVAAESMAAEQRKERDRMRAPAEGEGTEVKNESLSESESAQGGTMPTVDADSIASNVVLIAQKASEMFQGHCHEGQLKILVVVPPAVRLTPFSQEMGYDKRSVDISLDFYDAFNKVCSKHNLMMVHCDINMEESVDGVHITEKANALLAEAVWARMQDEYVIDDRYTHVLKSEITHRCTANFVRRLPRFPKPARKWGGDEGDE